VLEVLDELGYVEAVGEGVVGVDGDGHGVAAVALGDLAEGDLGGGVLRGEVSGVVDGGEVEPGEDGVADEVLVGVALEIGAGADAVYFEGGLLHEGDELGQVGVVGEADGAVGAADGAASVDGGEVPDGPVDDAGAEIFYLLGGGEGAVEQGEEDGEFVGFGEAKGLGAVYAHADAVVGLGEGGEEVVGGAAGPGVEVDLEGAGGGFLVHGAMVHRAWWGFTDGSWVARRGEFSRCACGFTPAFGRVEGVCDAGLFWPG